MRILLVKHKVFRDCMMMFAINLYYMCCTQFFGELASLVRQHQLYLYHTSTRTVIITCIRFLLGSSILNAETIEYAERKQKPLNIILCITFPLSAHRHCSVHVPLCMQKWYLYKSHSFATKSQTRKVNVSYPITERFANINAVPNAHIMCRRILVSTFILIFLFGYHFRRSLAYICRKYHF